MVHHPVNYADLSILSAFYHLRDLERAELSSTDPNDREVVQWAIRAHIVPRIRMLEAKFPGFTQRLKESLAYFLMTQKFPMEDVYYAKEPVFDLPADPIDYYHWAWEVLFRGQEYRLPSLDGYVEENTQP